MLILPDAILVAKKKNFLTFLSLVQFTGSTPSTCWSKICMKIRERQNNTSDDFSAEGATEKISESGSDMFGFSNPEVMKLIQV